MNKKRMALAAALLLLLVPFAMPERARIPVSGASRQDWNQKSFWYEPWGASGVHKGGNRPARHRTSITPSCK